MSKALKISQIKCARWSGEVEPKPAKMVDGTPVPLTREELEDTLVSWYFKLQEYDRVVGRMGMESP